MDILSQLIIDLNQAMNLILDLQQRLGILIGLERLLVGSSRD
jgi:hypothetical protein